MFESKEINGKWVRRWLLGICGFVLLIVLVGGVTRLTRSGLSMVDWRPIMGTLPPINETQWNEAFEAYKQFPEFKEINYNMELDEFKGIFFWEYFHRLLGRLLALLFLIPWLFFVFTRRLRGPLVFKSLFGFLLGGCQALLGWYMVKSGLVDQPHVSHYRLVAHLSLALLICVYFYWLYLSLREESLGIPRSSIRVPSHFKFISRFGFGLLIFQIVYGGLVAGLKAGLVFNTFPKMHGSWFPAGAFTIKPEWLNWLDNPGLVQFVHRTTAWILVAICISLLVLAYKHLGGTRLLSATKWLVFICFIQFVLGVSTLLMAVPVSLGASHQLVAAILLLSFFRLNFQIQRAS